LAGALGLPAPLSADIGDDAVGISDANRV